MGRVIFSVVVLVLLTILIVMNLGPTVPINLFGARFDKVPLVAIALLSFVVGVVYSLFLYVGHSIHRSSRMRLAEKHRSLEERERKLTEAPERATQADSPPPKDLAPGGKDGSPEVRPESALSRFFRLFR
ncbi:MAG TPA: LapA family protein [Spirochaetia bacterium]|nr:LapA family protein [Spirochaetia bacterium]